MNLHGVKYIILFCDPLMYTMNLPKGIVSKQIEEFISLLRVKSQLRINILILGKEKSSPHSLLMFKWIQPKLLYMAMIVCVLNKLL